jgi:hypothetical protein
MIISEAVGHFGMNVGDSKDFRALPRGGLRRVAVAWILCRRASLRQSWIAERLGLRSGDNVSARVKKFSAWSSKALPPEIRAWMKKLQ